MFKKILLAILMTGYLVNLAACSPYVTWKEEVKLNDGRIIVVEQKKRTEGAIAREAWLTINLPEFNAQPIIWHENLIPLIVNIDEGRLYVIGFPPTGREIRQYGNQSPPYIGFIWNHDQWSRIPFEKIPEQIYSVNMLLEGLAPKGTSLLTLEKKNSTDLNGDARYHYLLKINPKMGSGAG